MIDKILVSKKLAKLVNDNGGIAYFVGGYVRDKLINSKVNQKDIDIEVHGISQEKIDIILNEVGLTIKVGKAFGVSKFVDYDIDVALPRREVCVGLNHKDFDIKIDENMGTYEACKRRDFRMNAIMENILTGEIIDHFGGIQDIKNKVITHIDDKTFIQDPLRVLRAAQLSSRLDFEIDLRTIELCKKIDITKLSKERIFNELGKALLYSKKPSTFFYQLNKMNHLNYWFKELKDLQKIVQSPTFQNEGNVFIHTMMAIDVASSLIDKVIQPINFMLAVLCHDLGKAVTTEVIDGKIKSLGHEIEGIYIAKNMLKRLTTDKKVINYVCNMVKLHMRPNMFARDKSKIKSTNKMYDESVEPNDLIYVSISDNKGRISENPLKSPEKFLFDRLEIYKEYMSRDYVTGNDLIKNGIEQNEKFSLILDYAHNLRLEGVIKENSLRQTLAYAKKIYN